MSTAIQPTDQTTAVIEQVVMAGDLSNLKAVDRVAYYNETCRSLGLNPLTRPFEYITLNDKLTLYARRDATDQLRKIHGVTIAIVNREIVDNVYVVTARATTHGGRSDESIGAVALVKEDGEWKSNQNGKRYFAKSGQFVPLGPDDRANAIMKAETKAKRRVTLSIVGLGWLDETEIDTIRDARTVNVDVATGEIVNTPKLPAPQSHIAPAPLFDRVLFQFKRARDANITLPVELESVSDDEIRAMSDNDKHAFGKKLKTYIDVALTRAQDKQDEGHTFIEVDEVPA